MLACVGNLGPNHAFPFPFMESLTIPWKILSSTVALGLATDGWNLSAVAEGSDADVLRSFTFFVNFDAPFSIVPVVQVGLTGFDIDQRDSARISLKAESINEYGFQAVISTWASSRVYGIEFNWSAIGS